MPVSGRSSILSENTESNSRRTPRSPSKSAKGRGTSRLEVLERVGEGTLWIVYRVRERGVVGAPVLALKALKSAPNRHPRLPEKLFVCTLAWQKFLHPIVAPPVEVGTEEGTLFQTMEFLPGGSLEARIGKNALPPAVAFDIVRQLAMGLSFLHDQDVFHGDLRPCQILFDGAGTPRITDGGVAEAFAQSALALADVQGEVAYYLAPERTQGAPFSAAADIYSLGVIFYRLLTGRVPFDGASTLAISARHRSDAPVPPTQLRPKIPAEMEALVLDMLAKNPAERPTADEIVNEFELASPASGNGAPRTLIDVPSVATTPVAATPLPYSTLIDEDVVIPPSLPAQNHSPVVANAPKRQPLDDLVSQKLAADAQAKTQVSVEVAKKRHRRREFWGFLGAFFWLLILIGIGGGMGYGAYRYWITESPKEVVVPKYVGLNQESAKVALSKKGLYMKVVRESYDPEVPAGTVLVGEPEAGRTVRSRREVIVTVSAGRSPIKMVDFSRLTLNQARQIILKHGLRLGSVVQQYHGSIPDTFICGQFPEPGEPLRRSEPITLIVSRGAQPTEIDFNNTANGSNPTDPANSEVPPIDDVGQDNFDPLEPAQTGSSAVRPDIDRVVIRVQVPDGPAQNVRILVRDNSGERTVYQQVKSGGTNIKETIKIVKASGEIALVRVYIGDELVREQEF